MLYSLAVVGIAFLIHRLRRDVDFAVLPCDDAVGQRDVPEHPLVGKRREGGALQRGRVKEPLLPRGERHEQHTAG